MKEENLDYRGLFRFKHFGEIALNFNLDAIPSFRSKIRKLGISVIINQLIQFLNSKLSHFVSIHRVDSRLFNFSC